MRSCPFVVMSINRLRARVVTAFVSNPRSDTSKCKHSFGVSLLIEELLASLEKVELSDETPETLDIGPLDHGNHADTLRSHAIGDRSEYLIGVRESPRCKHRLADVSASCTGREHGRPRQDPHKFAATT